jgi:hypothetical protein
LQSFSKSFVIRSTALSSILLSPTWLDKESTPPRLPTAQDAPRPAWQGGAAVNEGENASHEAAKASSAVHTRDEGILSQSRRAENT